MNTASLGPSDVKVSVAMITYNHERFVAQAIESALMQQTEFAYELVIGEDCSTDGTRAIVQVYGERFPGRIRLLLPERNQGMMPNFIATMNACRGQYIALCEGDDYWTDPLKLQKQVDFLESHQECALCFHDVRFISDDDSCVLESHSPPNRKPIYTLDDILERCFIQTCSAVFRNGSISEYPRWFYSIANGDWGLFVLSAQQGNIGYIDERMAIYRLHAGAVWSSRSNLSRLKQIMPLYGVFYKHVGEAHGTAIRAGACTTIAACAAAQYENATAQRLSSSLAFVRTALEAAADAGYSNRSFVRMTRARSYEALGFVAYRSGDTSATRYCFARALALSPALARNTGLLSLLFEAIFGEKASALRRIAWPRR